MGVMWVSHVSRVGITWVAICVPCGSIWSTTTSTWPYGKSVNAVFYLLDIAQVECLTIDRF